MFDLIRHVAGGCARAFAIAERVDPAELQFLYEINGSFKIIVGFAREADDNIGMLMFRSLIAEWASATSSLKLAVVARRAMRLRIYRFRFVKAGEGAA